MLSRAAILYLASIAAHGAMAVGIVSLKGARSYEDIAIAMVESKKKPEEEKKEEPPPPPPPPKEESVKAKTAPAPKADAPPPPPPQQDAPAATSGSDAVPDFGLSLGGGGSSGSLAVPAPATAQPTASATADRVSKKVLAAPAPAKEEECAESPKKPKVTSINQPSYTTEAREAQVAGKVRIEVTVDATGKVVSARVLEGLGHGLDDAALSAAKGASFEAGTKCGKPATATFVIAIRFAL